MLNDVMILRKDVGQICIQLTKIMEFLTFCTDVHAHYAIFKVFISKLGFSKFDF